MSNKLPNFLIVGAAKSGTTALFQYLRQHPEMFIHSKKEGYFFSEIHADYIGLSDPYCDYFKLNVIKTLDEYSRLFAQVANEKAIGDISPDYLYYYKNSIKNIKKYLGDGVKIIMILRNPVDRAYSHYLHAVMEGVEPLSFEDALKNEDKRENMHWSWAWSYRAAGFYYNQVKSYLDNFKKVRVYLYDDFKADSLNVVKDIFHFLEIDNSFVPIMNVKFMVSGIPRNNISYYLVTKSMNLLSRAIPKNNHWTSLREVITAKMLRKPAMNPQTREYLKKVYHEDILSLQGLLKRDLTVWLEGEQQFNYES